MKIRAQFFKGIRVAVFERIVPIKEILAVYPLCRHEQRVVLRNAALDKGTELGAVKIKARECLAQCDKTLVIK